MSGAKKMGFEEYIGKERKNLAEFLCLASTTNCVCSTRNYTEWAFLLYKASESTAPQMPFILCKCILYIKQLWLKQPQMWIFLWSQDISFNSCWHILLSFHIVCKSSFSFLILNSYTRLLCFLTIHNNWSFEEWLKHKMLC